MRYSSFILYLQIPKKKSRSEDETLVEVTLRMEDLDADVIYAQDDEIEAQIKTTLDDLKTEEKRYVDLLECVSKVNYYRQHAIKYFFVISGLIMSTLHQRYTLHIIGMDLKFDIKKDLSFEGRHRYFCESFYRRQTN